MKEINKAYNPAETEDKIYKKWEDSGYFNPDKLPGKRPEYFSISMPPPNVTGVLHLGHALENVIMDTALRYHRLKGEKAVLIPGTDHAAVATQAKVEKNLIKDGIKDPRKELGREALLMKIREYAENSKATIIKQIKKMGTSCDWSRLAYTFDEKRSAAVNKVFIKMYNDGLIYRGYRVVNWSVKGQSTCSDDELVHIERDAKFYTFKYDKDFPFEISTTRPETKLGDTAVAVNPKDERYQKYIGQTFTANVGAKELLKIKIIADPEVDPNFGTGALGVTPAHALVDYEMAQKNNLPIIPVIGPDGRMTEDAGKEYVGLTVIEACEKFIQHLKDNGLLSKEEDIKQNVGTSDRFGDVVEVMPMTQWWINVNKEIPGRGKSLKDLMREAVTIGHNGDKNQIINITPENYSKIYLQWIDNLRDWCISRQIWWGHRIPVWYKKAKKGINITFIRHGQSEGNANDMGSGHTDDRLTEQGIEDVKAIKEKLLANFDVVFSSDLYRAKQTAEILFPEKEIVADIRLREIDFGDLTGKPNKERNKYRVSGFPNGESYQQVKDRVLSFLSDLIDNYDGKNVAIVAHSGVWKVLEIIFDKAAFTQEHLEIHSVREPVNYKLESLKSVGLNAPDDSWIQDEDTLDTWFSSGLWTFSTLGWPDNIDAKGKKTGDLKAFHPTTWMQMGYEILFFWMARMILMTTYILDEIPFKDVYIHGILRNKNGEKFSKSLGNGIDPIEVANQFGTDALRLSLISGTSAGNDSRFYEEKVEGNRNFVNKLWNISRYILTSVKEVKRIDKKPKANTLADEWILNQLAALEINANKELEANNFSLAIDLFRAFTWNDFADWYLEISKIEKDKDEILLYILERLLILWHPFIPFVTEAIWKNFEADDLLMVQSWPSSAKASEGTAFKQFNLIVEIISLIRNLRAENKIEPAKRVNVRMIGGKNVKLLNDQVNIIQGLARIENLEIINKGEKPAQSIGGVVSGVEVYILLEGLVDKAKESERLIKEIEQIKNYIVTLDKKLGNQEFVKNAPKEVVAGEQEKLVQQQDKLKKLEEQLESLKSEV